MSCGICDAGDACDCLVDDSDEADRFGICAAPDCTNETDRETDGEYCFECAPLARKYATQPEGSAGK